MEELKTTVHFCQATSSLVASSMYWHHPSVCSRSSILVCCPDIALTGASSIVFGLLPSFCSFVFSSGPLSVVM